MSQDLEVALIVFTIVMSLWLVARIAVKIFMKPPRKDPYWVDFWGRRHYYRG